MNNDEDDYPEPPELRKQGVPPLKKILRYIYIAIGIAILVVMAFAIYFKLRDS